MPKAPAVIVKTTFKKSGPQEGKPATEIKRIFEAYMAEAKEGKRHRERKVKDNWDGIHGRHDWSHKERHQSQEWLPDAAMAQEQIGNFIVRALVDFGKWFTMSTPGFMAEPPISTSKSEALLMNKLDEIDFPTIVADAVKIATVESVMTVKCYGEYVEDRQTFVEPGLEFITDKLNGQERTFPVVARKLVEREIERWRASIDLVPFEAYFPDPRIRRRRMYEIHRVERDLHEVIEIATTKGVYDPKVIEQITQDFEKQEDEAYKRSRSGQRTLKPPEFRKRVVIDELWGTLVNRHGRVMEKNVLCARANERYIIRPPEPNPCWHKESPFVSEPLIRVPLSVWHRAILDDAMPLNRVLSELVNLMLDAGFKAVWGVGQARPDLLASPEEITGGIPPGYTGVLKPGAPAAAKWYERLDTSDNPLEAMAVFNLIKQHMNLALATPDIRGGVLAPRAVKATEVVQQLEQTGSLFGGIAKAIDDKWIERVLRLTWMNMWHQMDDFTSPETVSILGASDAVKLQMMRAEERYALMAKSGKFKIYGVSAAINRAKYFQSIATLISLLAQSNALGQAYQSEFSLKKLLIEIIKTLDIAPERLRRGPEEPAQITGDANASNVLTSALTQGAIPKPEGSAEVPVTPAEEQARAPELQGT